MRIGKPVQGEGFRCKHIEAQETVWSITEPMPNLPKQIHYRNRKLINPIHQTHLRQ